MIEYSIHLYVVNDEPEYENLMSNNWIDSYDINTAINYVLYAKDLGINCTRPEFLMNYLSFITKVREQSRSDKMDIWKVFNAKIWTFILVFYLFCVLFNTIISRNNKFSKLEKLLTFLFIYFQTLLNGGDCRKPFNFVYLFWIISIFPLIEVFKNDILVNLITKNEIRIDAVEELLSLKFDHIFFHSSTLELWDKIFPVDSQNELSISFNKMKHLGQSFSYMMQTWMFQLQSLPDHQIMNRVEKIAISTHQHNIRVTHQVMSRFTSVHIASDQYLLTSITPFCYKPNFSHQNFAQNLYEILNFSTHPEILRI